MARLSMVAAMAAATMIGASSQAWAAREQPAGSGWHQENGVLTWVAPDRVPMGDAAVEFYTGDRLLGRPVQARDQRTFTLRVSDLQSVKDELQVRAAGRRLDAAPRKAKLRATAPVVPTAGPANPVDPGVKGPYPTITGEYDLPDVKLPDLPRKVEMRGVVVAPADASGNRPLALFLHGRHYTCYQGGDLGRATGEWPCPAGTTEVPSYRGYLQAQQLLASQGYLTVSISANGINGQDSQVEDNGAQARSSLVRLHLAHWADWAGPGRSDAPAIAKSVPPADLSKVLLMGHSRGGEGVSRAAMDSLTPPPTAQDGYGGPVRWGIGGMLLIGPTAFGQNPVPDVPSATILPGCDGDVSDLQGQVYVDGTRGMSRGAALHSALYVIGANHNFFNTEWTPGVSAAPSFDDFPSGTGDPVCAAGTKTRLSAAQQERVGATYLAAAARLFVGGDDRVRPLLDGTGTRAPSTDPATVLSHAVGAARTPAVLPDAGVTVTGGATRCLEVTFDEATACTSPDEIFASPHFTALASPEPGRYAVAITGRAPVTLRPPAPVSLADSQDLALRLIVPPNTTGNTFTVAITDTHGARADLGTVRVDGLSGSELLPLNWAREVRVGLAGAQVDLSQVATIGLTPGAGSARSLLLDAWGRRDGTPAVPATSLPRIDVGDVDVAEGGPGRHTTDVPVRVTGSGSGTVRLFLFPLQGGEPRSVDAVVRPGQSTVPAPVEWSGNDTFDSGSRWLLRVKAVQGLVVGDFTGLATIHNDDPLQGITVTPAASVTEGGTLTWQVSMTAPAARDLFLIAVAKPPTSGTELSSTDVDPSWFAAISRQDPLPSRPLSSTGLSDLVYIPAGDTTAQFTTPTVADDIAEGAEQIRWQLLSDRDLLGDQLPVASVTGTVTD